MSADRHYQRLHGLDWLRSAATVLVVALHAGIAYLVTPMPGLVWSTREPVGSRLIDAVTWWIDGFIMPLFFVLSGFVACGLMSRKGPAAFLTHRTRRVLLPFLLGCVLILPIDLYVWLLGWAADGLIPLRKLQSLKVEGPLSEGLWGVSHLWFLQYLWLFSAGAAGLCWLVDRRRKRRSQRRDRYCVLRARYADDLVAVLLAMATFALWWEPQLVIGFRHSWYPLPANLLFYLAWYALGWWTAVKAHGPRPVDTIAGEHSDTNRRSVFTGRNPWAWRVVASIGLFAILLPLIHQHVDAELTGRLRLVLAMLFVLHAWLAVTGWFGVCLHRLYREPPPLVKYVAAASFWVYLFHHPIVGLTQVSLRTAALPVEMKFVVTFVVGLAVPLLTYEALVRRTWIGSILNGRRDVRPLPTDHAGTIPVPDRQPRRKAA